MKQISLFIAICISAGLLSNNTPIRYDVYSTRYEALAGQYFKVVDVITPPLLDDIANNEPDKKHYIRLKSSISGHEVYYKYYNGSGLNFPFLVLGFYDKQKELLKGESLIFADGVVDGLKDIRTGKAIDPQKGETWKCYGVSIDENNFQFVAIFQNNKAQRIAAPHSITDRTSGARRRAYSAKEYKEYELEYGKSLFSIILKNRVGKGMTKEMCELAWGKPTEIVKKSTSAEEWIYPNATVEFNKNVVTAMSYNRTS